MGRGPPARRSDRGGEEIQAIRSPGARVGAAAASLALAVGLVTYAATLPERGGGAVALGLVGLALLAGGLVVARPVLVSAGIAGIGAAYVAGVGLGPDAIDRESPVVAAVFLLAAELAWWSLELRVSALPTPLLVRRVLILAGATLGALVAGAIVLVTARVEPSGGLVLVALGAAAAVGALVIVAALAARAGRG
jgi:hypothetical protein